MYQEETYETNDDEAREAAILADDRARLAYDAALAQQTLWAGPIVPYADDSPITLPPGRVRSNQQKEVA